MTTKKQRRENRTAKRAKKRNDRDLKKLGNAQKQLDSLPPAAAGSKEEARRKRIQQAINDKTKSLEKQNELLDDFVESDDDDEREEIHEKIDAERDDYRDTSDLGGGRSTTLFLPASESRMTFGKWLR